MLEIQNNGPVYLGAAKPGEGEGGGGADSDMSNVYGTSFSAASASGTRLYASVGKSFAPSTDTTAGTDDFANTPVFKGYYMLVKYNSTSGKAEPIAYEGTPEYTSIKAAGTEDYDEVYMYPKFYYKHTVNTDGSSETLLSPTPKTGFKPSSMHYRWDAAQSKYVMHDYIGVTRFGWGYTSGSVSDMAARKGLYPLTNITRDSFETKARARGMRVFGMKELAALQMLGDIKYAHKNWQTAVSKGYCSAYPNFLLREDTSETQTAVIDYTAENALLFAPGRYCSFSDNQAYNQVRKITEIDTEYDTTNNYMKITFEGAAAPTITVGTTKLYPGLCPSGLTESVKGMDGKAASLSTNDQRYPSVYLGIENLFGNQWKFLTDTMRMDGTSVSYYNRSSDSSKDWPTSSDLKDWKPGPTILTTEGYIKRMTPTAGLSALDYLSIPAELGGTDSNPIGDYQYSNAASERKCCLMGGNLDNGLKCGPFSLTWRSALSTAGWNYGALGVFVPEE